MRLELAISLRYLYSPRSEGALAFLTWVAVGGITLGVAALIVAMSVMNGYQVNLVKAMAGALPHISLHPVQRGGFADIDSLRRMLKSTVKPESVAPFAMKEALLAGTDPGAFQVQGAVMRGVLPSEDTGLEGFLPFLDDGLPGFKQLPLETRLSRGRKLLDGLATRLPQGEVPILVSRLMARSLSLKLGNVLSLLEYPKPGEGFSPKAGQGRLKITGFFDTGIVAFDELVVISNLHQLNWLYGSRAPDPSLGVRLADPMRAAEAADRLRSQTERSGSPFYVYSWLESNAGLFQVIRLQKTMLFLVLMLIVIIAFFGMVSALIMMVTEKTREITILKSLGAKNRTIHRVFLWQGLFIGIVGAILGTACGLGIAWVLDTFPLIEIPSGVYPGSDRIPVLVSFSDVSKVLVGTMVVCLAATLFPARKATALHPIDGLWQGRG